PALVWYAVWDDARAAGRFLRAAAGLRRPARAGYRAQVDSLDVSGAAATRLVLAPPGWSRWDSLPAARLEGR
ncbi:MAG TPA: hypothetical protein VEB59_00105, partial [Gemmatimonadales bacterium]|nr:hypothetical protein [Gemmatimonadales bacterium]